MLLKMKSSNKEIPEMEPEIVEERNGITQISTEGSTIAFHFSGEIDATNYEEIQEQIFAKLEESSFQAIEIRMRNVTYISSAGLRMFSTVKKKTQELGLELKLVGVRSDILKLFKITGYAGAFHMELLEE